MEEANKTNPAEPEQEQNPEADDQYVFYNVMPRDKSQGKVVGPKLIVSTPADSQVTQPSDPGFFAKYKKIIFIAAGALVLIGAGYFVYAQFFSGPSANEMEDLVANINNKPKKQQQPPQEQRNEFTTPQEWRDQYFGKDCTETKLCRDEGDSDKDGADGLTNLEEYNLKTDPNNNDSDGDGIADGDEVHVFGTNPLDAHSGSDKAYSDTDNIKGGYNFNTGQKYTETELKDIKTKLDKYGVHPPTNKTLPDELKKIYHFGENLLPAPEPENKATSSSSTALSALTGFDVSPEAKQDRDSKRSDVIRAVGIAIAKYQADRKDFPKGPTFPEMTQQIKPYLKVATNTVDPINKDPFVYGYSPSADGKDYTLSYYSETQNLLIKKHYADAVKDQTAQQADLLDEQRKRDLESLRTALLLYSGNNAGTNQDFVFPPTDKYKAELLTNNYIGSIPKDPKTGQDYQYQVSDKFNTFTLKAKFDNSPTGTTGWGCNQDDCDYY